MNDAFTNLLNAGIPLDVVQKYLHDRVPLDEVWMAVSGMLERGMSISEILQEDGKPQEVPPEAPPMLSTVSAVDLQKKNIPPIRWVVQDLIPAGLSILASPPKFGKSWAVLQMGLSVAYGGSFLGYRCNKAEVLYLALEDGERRLKGRMSKILGPVPAPHGFDFVTTAPALSTGLLEVLDVYLMQHPDNGLVIIDTLQKVRGVGGSRDVYGRDYADVGALKKLADSRNVALVLVHHLNKGKDDGDPFLRISGTNGLTGAADTMLVMTKAKRNEDTTTLSVTGRDVEMQELVLQFDKNTCLWRSLGDSGAFAEQQARTEYADSPIVRTVKKLLQQSIDKSWTGTAQQLLDAGTYIVRERLADSSRGLTSKIKDMVSLLLEYDGIGYEYKPNGNGGGKHRFYYVDAPQFEEMEQSEITPFSEG